MIERIWTPDQQRRREIQLKTLAIKRENLRKNLEHWLAKATTEDNQTLIAQLQTKFKDLHL